MDTGELLNVVVVNESPDVVRLFVDLISEGRHSADGLARGGRSAHQLAMEIDARLPDVVVFDIPYPYQEQWSRFREVRNALKHEPVFLIVSTHPELVEALAISEGLAFLAKPFAVSQALETLAIGAIPPGH